MVKIDTYQRATVADFPEMDERFLEKMNRDLERLFVAVQGRLTPDDNLNADTIILRLGDEQEVVVKVSIKGVPTRAKVIATPGYYDYLPDLAWKVEDETTIRLKVKWATAPADKQEVMIEIGGG